MIIPDNRASSHGRNSIERIACNHISVSAYTIGVKTVNLVFVGTNYGS